MPPRLYLFSGSQSLAARTTNRVAVRSSAKFQIRSITADEKPLPTKEEQNGSGPNTDQLPHVSEEAAAMGKITGEGGPDMSQGTPVQEIFERDPDAQKNAPEVLKQDLSQQKSQSTQTRSFSTSAIRRSPELVEASSGTSGAAPPMAVSSALQNMLSPASPEQGTKFGMPEKSLERTDHFKHRYHPLINQLTNMMMRDGKLAKAQRNMEIILNHLRTAPPPKPAANIYPILQSYYNPPITGYIPSHATKEVQNKLKDPNNNIIPPNPPQLIPSLLPLDPMKYLELAIDSVAPMVKVRNQRGVLGGGAALQIPVPLPQKQRRRASISWILAAADKRKEVRLADRVARELVNIVEGKSSVWQRRELVHKMGITARSNVRFASRRR